jgi:hypothetical protein
MPLEGPPYTLGDLSRLLGPEPQTLEAILGPHGEAFLGRPVLSWLEGLRAQFQPAYSPYIGDPLAYTREKEALNAIDFLEGKPPEFSDLSPLPAFAAAPGAYGTAPSAPYGLDATMAPVDLGTVVPLAIGAAVLAGWLL